MNTASCKSAITFIDGDKGILRYRGYPIEQLAEKATFLEVAWLLRHGELPKQSEYDQLGARHHVPHVRAREHARSSCEGFRYDAHPMSMLNSSASPALSSFYPEAKNILRSEIERNISIIRLLAKMPTLAAFCYRHVKGLPFVYPDNDLSLRREFPLDGRADDRAEVRGESDVREGARDSVHPPRRSRAELLDERRPRRRLVARRSVLGDRGRRRGAVRSAARRRERAGAAHDQRDRPPRRTSRRSSTR